MSIIEKAAPIENEERSWWKAKLTITKDANGKVIPGRSFEVFLFSVILLVSVIIFKIAETISGGVLTVYFKNWGINEIWEVTEFWNSMKLNLAFTLPDNFKVIVKCHISNNF